MLIWRRIEAYLETKVKILDSKDKHGIEKFSKILIENLNKKWISPIWGT